MYLVLCSSNDIPAIWAHERLREAGLRPLELVTSEALARAKTWEHRGGSGGARIWIELGDGRSINGERIRGVLNRITAAPLEPLANAAESDREYAMGEMGAFYLGWMHTLPNMLNRPAPQGLCGSWRHASEWALLAARAGLPVMPYRHSDSTRIERGYGSLAPEGTPHELVIALRGRVFGHAPVEIEEGCRRLAEYSGAGLLGVEFYESARSPWTFAYANLLPDLMVGGPPLIEALANELRKESVQ